MIDQPQFDGESFQQWRDGGRLQRQLDVIRAVMSDHQEHTLNFLAERAGCSVASASARLRDLRKERFGAHTIVRSYVANGVWLYRMAP